MGDSSISASPVLLAARRYVSRGFLVVPIPSGRNRPLQSKWQDLRLGEDELPKYFGPEGNVGLLLLPSGLVDVDCDCPEAVAAAQILLPRTEMVHGHASNPSSHLYFRATNLSKNSQFLDPRRQGKSTGNRSTIVEIRVNGQTVVPPSINQRSGEPVVWEVEGEPAAVTGVELRTSVGRVASAALISRYWSKGARHDAAMALASMLLRAGWMIEDVQKFVKAVVTAAHDEEGPARLRDVASTLERLRQQLPATGTPTLAQIIGSDIVEQASEWLQLSVPSENSETDSFHHTDLGNAQRLVAAHGENLRFDFDSGRWLLWDGALVL